MSHTATDCICMYSPAAEGGHPLYVSELMTGLANRDPVRHRFELISSRNLEPQFRQNKPYVINDILEPLRNKRDFRTKLGWVISRVTHYAAREMRLVKWLKTRPDVTAVHFQEWTPWLAARLFAQLHRMGKRVYYTVHNVVPHKYPKYLPKSVMNGWIRKACRRCDCLFVHTDRLAEELSKFLGAGHPPIRVTPHGVWTVRDTNGQVAKNDVTLAERLSWKRLLFFGTIRRNKGLDVLLRAAETLPLEYQITISGEPSEGDYFRNEVMPLVERLRAAGRKVEVDAKFLPDDQVSPLLARHSAVILPYTKGFVAQSGVVFLALAHDLPVVASAVGGLRDLFAECPVGTIFEDNTPAGLAAAIRELFERRDPRDVAEAMRDAKQRYSWDESARATIEGYELGRRTGEARAITEEVLKPSGLAV